MIPDRGLTESSEIRRRVEGRKARLTVVVVHVPVAGRPPNDVANDGVMQGHGGGGDGSGMEGDNLAG
jgi:hypothetical protein